MILLAAAGQGCNLDPSHKSRRQFSQDGTERHCFALMNGRVDVDDLFPAVVHLTTADKTLCTGTFVSDQTLITAAHCLDPRSPAGGLVASIDGRLVRPLAALAPEVGSMANREVKDDVAVLLFPPATSAHWRPLSAFPPRVGQKISIVGFGQTDFVRNNQSDLKRRHGTNTIKEITENGTAIKYELAMDRDGNPLNSEDAMTGRGDSGGPLFLGDRLIGIVSRGLEKITAGKLQEYDTNLFTGEMAAFFHSTEAEGAKITGLDEMTQALATDKRLVKGTNLTCLE